MGGENNRRKTTTTEQLPPKGPATLRLPRERKTDGTASIGTAATKAVCYSRLPLSQGGANKQVCKGKRGANDGNRNPLTLHALGEEKRKGRKGERRKGGHATQKKHSNERANPNAEACN